jgi:hypothetical protein
VIVCNFDKPEHFSLTKTRLSPCNSLRSKYIIVWNSLQDLHRDITSLHIISQLFTVFNWMIESLIVLVDIDEAETFRAVCFISKKIEEHFALIIASLTFKTCKIESFISYFSTWDAMCIFALSTDWFGLVTAIKFGRIAREIKSAGNAPWLLALIWLAERV